MVHAKHLLATLRFCFALFHQIVLICFGIETRKEFGGDAVLYGKNQHMHDDLWHLIANDFAGDSHVRIDEIADRFDLTFELGIESTNFPRRLYKNQPSHSNSRNAIRSVGSTP